MYLKLQRTRAGLRLVHWKRVTCLLSCSVFVSQSESPALCAESLAKTLLGMNSPDNILLEKAAPVPPRAPADCRPPPQGPRTRPSSWLCSLALCANVRPLCSVQPVASRPPCRWSSSRAPGPGPRASAPRLPLPVLASSPPRPVLRSSAVLEPTRRPPRDPSLVILPASPALPLQPFCWLVSTICFLLLNTNPHAADAQPLIRVSLHRPLRAEAGLPAALVPSPLVPLCSRRASALRLRGRSPQRVWSVVILPPRAAACDTDRCHVLKHCQAKAPVGPAYLVFLRPLGRFFLSLR